MQLVESLYVMVFRMLLVESTGGLLPYIQYLDIASRTFTQMLRSLTGIPRIHNSRIGLGLDITTAISRSVLAILLSGIWSIEDSKERNYSEVRSPSSEVFHFDGGEARALELGDATEIDSAKHTAA